jgi:hypothetical protein
MRNHQPTGPTRRVQWQYNASSINVHRIVQGPPCTLVQATSKRMNVRKPPSRASLAEPGQIRRVTLSSDRRDRTPTRSHRAPCPRAASIHEPPLRAHAQLPNLSTSISIRLDLEEVKWLGSIYASRSCIVILLPRMEDNLPEVFRRPDPWDRDGSSETGGGARLRCEVTLRRQIWLAAEMTARAGAKCDEPTGCGELRISAS